MEPLIVDIIKDASLDSIQDILTSIPGNKYDRIAKDGIKCSHLLAAHNAENLVEYITSLKPLVEWDSKPFENLLLGSKRALDIDDLEVYPVADAFTPSSALFNSNFSSYSNIIY